MRSLNIITGDSFRLISKTAGGLYIQKNMAGRLISVYDETFIDGYEFFINNMPRWQLP
jgi:hypothetical protein